MKGKKNIFLTLAMFVVCLNIYGQNSQQIRILNNYATIPFEDGKTVIAEVSFIGLTDDSDLRKTLKYYQANIKAGDSFFGSNISKAVKAIRESLTFEGYDKAEIIALGEPLPNNQMKLIFSVNRGEKAKVLEILFEGNKNIPSEDLAASVKQCVGSIWMRFVKRNYDYITQKCARELMSSKGYLKAEIKNIIYQPDKKDNVVLIEVKEGNRYRIGEIEIKGLSVFSEEQFLKIFGQKTGDIANGKVIRNFLYDKLNSAYKNIGYLQYDAEFDPEFISPKIEGQDGIINLKIQIDEGRQFKLFKVEITGVNQKDAQKLRQILAIKDGGIYNWNKVKVWVDEINKIEKFGYIDFDKDTEISTDGETDRVYLVLKINPK